jgi:hypothetical protein
MAVVAAAPQDTGSLAVNAPTFSRDIAPILFKHCTSCHRPGEIAPMSLLTFKETRPWARSISAKVMIGAMPPWHADSAHGEFSNERRLSEAEKDTIVKWVTAGAPEGDPVDLPPPPAYVDGWQIGEPDAVFSMNEDYSVPASGTLEYKYFEVPTNFAEDKWIQALETRPGSRAVVHHVIVFARAPKPPPREPEVFSFAEGMDEPKNPEAEANKKAPLNDRPAPMRRGTFLGGFAPGQSVRVYPPGSAIRLPAGATLILQMHYTANGKADTDRTRVGVIFAKETPKQEVKLTALMNQNFTIPAGADDYQVDAEMTLQRDVTMWSMLPHTHLRGVRWKYQAMYPDGRLETILAVPKYDFNWQTEYVFKEPLKLPKGTRIHSTAWYDNSAKNRFNPDPKVDVHWGDQTWEEMQFTGLAYTVDPVPSP